MDEVELNALPSDVLVDFVERKLQGFREKRILPRKVVPDVQVLAEAYRMFKREPHIQAAVAAENARLGSIPVPADLEFKVREYLAEHPEVFFQIGRSSPRCRQTIHCLTVEAALIDQSSGQLLDAFTGLKAAHRTFGGTTQSAELKTCMISG